MTLHSAGCRSTCCRSAYWIPAALLQHGAHHKRLGWTKPRPTLHVDSISLHADDPLDDQVLHVLWAACYDHVAWQFKSPKLDITCLQELTELNETQVAILGFPTWLDGFCEHRQVLKEDNIP